MHQLSLYSNYVNGDYNGSRIPQGMLKVPFAILKLETGFERFASPIPPFPQASDQRHASH